MNKDDKEEMVNVSFMLKKSKRRLLRIKAAKQGVTVSDLLREATNEIVTKPDGK